MMMTLSEILNRVVVPLITGILLGIFFFGGLWWTVQKGVSSKQPAFWFLGSLVLRVSLTLTGFYGISAGGHWERLLACLLGFIVSRYISTRVIRYAA
jgi:F1F0 ATPase subunit 2